MDILFLLVPMSVVLALLVIAVFAFALDGGQFDDLGAEGERIFDDEVPATEAAFDPHQAFDPGGPEQSLRSQPETCR